jgi:predicted ABC-type ATPase
VQASAGESFAFETTLSGHGYGRKIPHWQASGYWVEIFFLSLPSVDIAIERVKARVAQGGHDIPEQVIRRRFGAGLANFQKVFTPLVDGWKLYDNSGRTPVLLDWGEKT